MDTVTGGVSAPSKDGSGRVATDPGDVGLVRRGLREGTDRAGLDISELELARLRLDVALDVVSLLDRVVEEHEGRSVVVNDIVECWLRLDPAVREQYNGLGVVSGLAAFGGEYVDVVDRSWSEFIGVDPYTLHDSVTERLGYFRWQTHIAQVRRRVAAGLPPERDWLAGFPMPADQDDPEPSLPRETATGGAGAGYGSHAIVLQRGSGHDAQLARLAEKADPAR
jgi:hypothetical protein